MQQRVTESTPPAVRAVPAPLGGDAHLTDPVAGEWTVVVVDLPDVADALRAANLVTVDDAPATAEEAITGMATDSSEQLAIVIGDDGSDTLPKIVNAGRALGVNVVVIARTPRAVPQPSVSTPASLNDLLVTLSSLEGWPRLLSPAGWDTIVDTMTAPPGQTAGTDSGGETVTPPASAPVEQAVVAPASPDAQQAAAYSQEVADYQARLEAWAAQLQAQQAEVAAGQQAIAAQRKGGYPPPVQGGPPSLPATEEPVVISAPPYQDYPPQGAGQAVPAETAHPVAAAPVDWQPQQAVRRLGQVFALASKAGGVGKTSLSVAIADHLARTLPGRRVAVVDANIQQGDVRVFLERYVSQGISSLEALRTDPAISADPDAAVARHMTGLDSGLQVMFAPPAQAGNPALLTPTFLAMVIRVLRQHFDWIFVDTQSAEWHDEMFTEFVLPVADRFLIVVNPSLKSVRNNHEWIEQLKIARYAGGANIDPSRISVILNRNDTPGCLRYEEVEQMLDYPHFLGVVPERAGQFDVVATADRQLNAALGILCHRLTGDPGLTPRTVVGRRRQLGRLRQLIERGGGR